MTDNRKAFPVHELRHAQSQTVPWPRRLRSKWAPMSKCLVVIPVVIVLTGSPPAACALAPFTFVAIPDTQYYSSLNPDTFYSETQWIVNHRASNNIAFVAHEGDLTDYDDLNQWSVATTAMYALDNTSPRLPWGTSMGNHDDPYHYDAFFGPSRFAGQSWYGGSYSHSSYQKFWAGGRHYLVLNLEYLAGSDVQSWAQSVISTNPGMPTIVNTHAYLNIGERNYWANSLWSHLIRPNSQIFAVLCGHIGDEGEYRQTSLNAAGQPVFELLADYQDDTSSNGYLRLLEFDEANSVIHVQTYAPNTNVYKTGSSSQFDLPINFDTRLGLAVPEPSPCILALVGILGLVVARRFGRA